MNKNVRGSGWRVVLWTIKRENQSGKQKRGEAAVRSNRQNMPGAGSMLVERGSYLNAWCFKFLQESTIPGSGLVTFLPGLALISV